MDAMDIDDANQVSSQERSALLEQRKTEQSEHQEFPDEVQVDEDAEALGCRPEVEHVRHILAHGTSAHHQLRVHAEAVADGASEEEALCAVVDYLIAETAVDTAPA